LAFSVKVMANCPMGDGTFKRALLKTKSSGPGY
jgi:hypothetical protein